VLVFHPSCSLPFFRQFQHAQFKKKVKRKKRGFFWMLSLTLHSLLNASIVRYNYNSYFITVFSLHWPLRVLYWERCLLVRCVFILYFYHLFVFCGRVFFLDWDVGCVATICLIFSRSHVSPYINGIWLSLPERGNYAYKHTPFISQTFLLEHHC